MMRAILTSGRRDKNLESGFLFLKEILEIRRAVNE